MEDEQRQCRCCFTGHRPEKLTEPEDVIRVKLRAAIQEAIADGYTEFITGMARGVDIWAAEVVLGFKANDENIKLICAIPFDGFERRWADEWRARYNAVKEAADEVVYVSRHYYSGCFQVRNEWMVDHSHRLIAVYNGEAGGTRNTITYAKRNSHQIIVVSE